MIKWYNSDKNSITLKRNFKILIIKSFRYFVFANLVLH